VQEVAFVLDHVRLEAEFFTTIDGDAVSVTVGGGGGGGSTLTAAVALLLPPGPVQVSV
jgi:ABC-type uncharacterized transport system YnjBCD ATPase subunit